MNAKRGSVGLWRVALVVGFIAFLVWCFHWTLSDNFYWWSHWFRYTTNIKWLPLILLGAGLAAFGSAWGLLGYSAADGRGYSDKYKNHKVFNLLYSVGFVCVVAWQCYRCFDKLDRDAPFIAIDLFIILLFFGLVWSIGKTEGEKEEKAEKEKGEARKAEQRQGALAASKNLGAAHFEAADDLRGSGLISEDEI